MSTKPDPLTLTISSRFPIERKLPLLIGVLLIAMIGFFTWAAYRGVERAVAASGSERLAGVAQQITEMLERSTSGMPDSARRFARDPRLVRYLRTGRQDAAQAARSHLERGAFSSSQSIARVELRTLSGEQLIAVRRSGPDIPFEPDGDILTRSGSKVDSGSVGRLRLVNDTIVYPTMVPVIDGGASLGYLVQWRVITATRESREQLLRLIGSGAHLYIGNDSGDVFTDLVGPVAAPTPRLPTTADTTVRSAEGVAMMVASRPVPRSPWVVRMEFPRDVVMQPATDILRRLLIVAAVVLALGLLLSWGLSRSIARPLRQLTHAAHGISAGDYTQRVVVDRNDELGVLADSFNTMVGKVANSQQVLEQKVRERTAELQEKNAELEAFGYSISHDLRAPLRAMHGFSQALLDDYGDRLDDTGRRFAGRMVDAARRMDLLIQDLLAYSRISRSELPLEKVDLGRALRTALSQLEADITNRQAEVIIRDPLPAVVGNEQTIAQAVANLISNGIKFVPEGRRPRVEVGAERADGRVRVSVRDNGIGIAPEHQARIFGVFERLHTTEEYPGTGIGLAIVRKGMERMSGTFGLESRPGEGSRFWIELPAGEGAA